MLWSSSITKKCAQGKVLVVEKGLMLRMEVLCLATCLIYLITRVHHFVTRVPFDTINAYL